MFLLQVFEILSDTLIFIQIEMCIIFSIVNGNPQPGGYKLIIASNRDEFYSRPASIAKEWTPLVYGGLFFCFVLIDCCLRIQLSYSVL